MRRRMCSSGVAPRAQALLLHLGRRRADEHAVGLRAALEHLAGTLDVDLEHDVTVLSAGSGIGVP